MILRDGPLPRRVQFTPDGWKGLVVGLLLFGAGLLMCGFLGLSAFRQEQQRTALRQDGRDIVGRVITTHAGHGDSTVSYTFTVNGSTYLGKAQMPNYRLALRESDEIAVRFLPSNPALNHPAAWEWSGLRDFMPKIFALFFMIVGAIALGALLRDRKLAREGKVAEGVVTDCACDKSWFRVDYEFRTEDGELMKGHNDFKDEYGAGARMWILYLSQKPRRNHSYPLPFFEVVE
jgi:hypothetical protein